MRIFCILLLAVLHSGVASAQHRVGVQGAVITKFKLTDNTRFTPVATFEFYLKNLNSLTYIRVIY